MVDYNKIQLGIIEYFGDENQFEKLREEVEEFIQAVQNKDYENMVEEFVDVYNVLDQFKLKYKLEDDLIVKYRCEKILRTDKRKNEGYYERKISG